MYILSHIWLNSLKTKLKIWNKDTFGDVQSDIDMALVVVDLVKQKISKDYYYDNFDLEEKSASDS